jgi:hypothetical protein
LFQLIHYLYVSDLVQYWLVLISSTVLNPVARLQWFRNYRSTTVDMVRSNFIDAVCFILLQ